MSNQAGTLMRLWCDDYRGEEQMMRDVVGMARRLLDEIERPDVRGSIERGPLSEVNHQRLRWLLMAVARSESVASAEVGS